ncbi:MAG: hypothetical protein HFJ55_07500 [Clostridia bacterium]|nr:hypothetical protein [Clostridia bacterium]
MKKKKILMITIIIIVVLAIVSAGITFLILATDLFKSSSEMFSTYIKQEMQKINKMTDSSILATYNNVKSKSIYESNTTVKLSYAEGGEVSHPINNLALEFNTQKDNENVYKDVQILYDNQPQIKIEGIKQKDIYGVRFTNALKEFLSIRDSQNLQEEADKIGVDKDILETFMSIMDSERIFAEELLSKEDLKSLKETYSNIIVKNIKSGTFSKQRNTMITYDNKTVKTNAYIVALDSEQVKNLITEILNNVITDPIILEMVGGNEEVFVQNIEKIIENLGIDKKIPELKITVYENNKVAIRTTIETGLQTISIDSFNNDEQLKLNIDRKVLDNEKQNEQNIEITKANSDNSESYNVITNIIDGDNEYKVEANINTTTGGGALTTNGNIKFSQGIKTINIELKDTTYTTIEEKKAELNSTNNVILSDLDDANRTRILTIVKNGVPQVLNNKIMEILQKTQMQGIGQIFSNNNQSQGNESNEGNEPPQNDKNTTQNPEVSQIEINRFNSKFEFYTGDSVSAENVKMLLDIVKSNLNSIEFITTQKEDGTSEIKGAQLNIEKDKENVELANQVLQIIDDDSQKYKVSINYNSSNGMVSYITINEIAK